MLSTVISLDGNLPILQALAYYPLLIYMTIGCELQIEFNDAKLWITLFLQSAAGIYIGVRTFYLVIVHYYDYLHLAIYYYFLMLVVSMTRITSKWNAKNEIKR